jgi:anthranilate phosphoribosyltransferase
LNAAAALVVAEALEPKAAADKVQAVLDNGRALAALNRWRDVANSNRRVEA